MSNQEPAEETVPTASNKQKPSAEVGATQRVKSASGVPAAGPRRWPWILGGLGVFSLLLGIGALSGYQSAVAARTQERALQSAVEANFQFQLAMEDMQASQCTRARDRLVYVIQLVPDYPQAQEQLVQASLCVGAGTSQASAPEGQVTAEPTPTPDLRGADTIFADSQNQLGAKTWDTLLPLLDTLRKNYPDYQPIEVDRMYYIAYRNRGADRILSGDLEQGIFDLNRAEQIGPLDNEVNNYRLWAVWYIVGASFWEVDWAQAVQYFQQLAAAAPSLHDTNGITSTDRLAQAQVGYSDLLVKEAQRLALDKHWCDADQKMSEANEASPLNGDNQALWDSYIERCSTDGNND